MKAFVLKRDGAELLDYFVAAQADAVVLSCQAVVVGPAYRLHNGWPIIDLACPRYGSKLVSFNPGLFAFIQAGSQRRSSVSVSIMAVHASR
jgi:hypothetical protein